MILKEIDENYRRLSFHDMLHNLAIKSIYYLKIENFDSLVMLVPTNLPERVKFTSRIFRKNAGVPLRTLKVSDGNK